MRIESKLCHVSENKVIVQVFGWLDDQNLGSALAEGTTVESAEDKAISRLKKRIDITSNSKVTKWPITENKNQKALEVALTKSQDKEAIHIDNEPSDWSSELIAIDSEIERLGWSREDEINFLVKTFGYNNRNKITTYNDIIKYLKLLKETNIKTNLNYKETNVNSLISESDILLRELSWDNIKGREYLRKEFNVSTRKELNEEQLISFVSKLNSILKHNLTS